MKRIIALLIVMTVLVLSFASCGLFPGGNKGNEDTPGPNNPQGGGDDNTNSKYPWNTTELIFQISEDSDASQLPSSSRRYLAGDITGYENDRDRVDDYVSDRNSAASSETNVTVQYQYLPDNSDYGWGKSINYIDEQVKSGDAETPDVYVNFVYDMVAASLKGAFANLLSKTMYEDGHDLAGSEHNYFAFEDNARFEDTGDGYMYEYMRSLTLSKHKMYCLSSDYFVDMVRAFFVVPVNIGMLETIPVTTEEGKYNTDRNGDGKYTIDDFYTLVWDMEWTYETLADFSSYIALEQDGVDGTSVKDRIGFVLGTSSGLPAAGMLYSTSINIVKREYNTEICDYTHSYPNMKRSYNAYGDVTHSFDITDSDSTLDELVGFCNNLSTLMQTNGVTTISTESALAMGYWSEAQAIRQNFASGNVLFGGVVVLGALEHEDYLGMKGEGQKGYGIAPVPLYRSDSNDKYSTQIHNNGKIGAIAYSTKKFAQCTAYLNYQSLNSSEVLNEYYKHALSSTVQDTYTNTEMLDYIRDNVRSNFDKTYEDALGEFYKSATNGTSEQDKWHNMIKAAQFQMTEMREKYASVSATKADRLYNLETKIFPGLPE